MVYTVIGKEEQFRVLTLTEAMNVAKSMNEFVTIKGGEFDIVGKFGVDVVVDNVCPDGVEYSWKKRRQ